MSEILRSLVFVGESKIAWHPHRKRVNSASFHLGPRVNTASGQLGLFFFIPLFGKILYRTCNLVLSPDLDSFNAGVGKINHAHP